MVGQKVEEEKEEEAHRDSYLLLSLFLLFSCPPSAAAPSSFIALLLLLLEPSAEATQLKFRGCSSAPRERAVPDAPRRATPRHAALFLLPSSLPLGRVTTLASPPLRPVFPLLPSLKPHASSSFLSFFLPSFFSPLFSRLLFLFSLSPSRVPRLSVVSTFKRGMATRTRSRASAFAVLFLLFSMPPSFLAFVFSPLYLPAGQSHARTREDVQTRK